MTEKTLLSDGAFLPPRGLRNAHVQTIFSSMGPRQYQITKRFAPYRAGQREVILDCGDGIRLAGCMNQASTEPSSTLAILIHGWEGSQDSSYMLSMAASLLASGVDVFRLNMRDHGETHHLNEGLFNSTLVDEVMGAIEDLQARFAYPKTHLVGFSLGGNFSLRVAALAHDRRISLSSVIAFCPVIHAGASNTILNSKQSWLYGTYFVRKWKRSLKKKLEHFPDYGYGAELAAMKTLDEMNRKLIPQYTAFTSIDEYFDAYAISGERMAHTICPCYLHFAKDDMIIPVEGVTDLANNPDLHVTITEYGGHCGFLQNWQLDSWQDQRALQIISSVKI